MLIAGLVVAMLAPATRRIVAGLGLSAAGMVVAALGYLPPTAGALAQEAVRAGTALPAASTTE